MTVRIFVLVIAILVMPLGAWAEQSVAADPGLLGVLGMGAVVVNSGVALANGITLAGGNANATNGRFGLVLGSTTVAVSAVSLIATAGKESQNFSFLLGAAGLASAVTGALSIHFDNDHMTIAPMIDPFAGRDEPKAGLQLNIRF